MYRIGSASQFGPGTGLVERYGMGSYVGMPDYFSTPAGAAGIRGMGCGCAGVGCACDGLGQTGIFGTSLFESSSPSDWGLGEWAVILVGGYVVFSVFHTTKRAAGYARSVPKRTKKAARAVKSAF